MKIAANLSLLFGELPLIERIVAARIPRLSARIEKQLRLVD